MGRPAAHPPHRPGTHRYHPLTTGHPDQRVGVPPGCPAGGTAPPSTRSRTTALRDYLRQRPDEIHRYSALKVALAQRFPADREGRAAYSTAKSALVENLVARSYAARAAGAS
ncbi:GrpB family protein [Streptomyces atratus]|uniref:GrpB family protein n=1 Tax=Streptomyces atratus TaxID=1893 RepID=UPI00366703A8